MRKKGLAPIWWAVKGNPRLEKMESAPPEVKRSLSEPRPSFLLLFILFFGGDTPIWRSFSTLRHPNHPECSAPILLGRLFYRWVVP